MATTPEPTSAPSAVTPGVAFEVERFEWTSRDRLELVGRWFGLRGHRFLRPTLDVEVDGERRRMLAVLEHKPWAPADGEDWIAAFTWRGEPAHFDDAELTVSPDLAVQLPAPGGSMDRGEAKSTTRAAERRPARRPRSAVLEEELAAALAEVERLGAELERTRTVHSEAAKELRERLRGEHTRIQALEEELEQARGQIAAAEAAAAEAAKGLRRERDEIAAERDAATTARDAALATAAAARGELDAMAQKLSAAEAERDAMTEARDRARQERNAWMSRARAAAAGRPSAEASPARAPEAAPAHAPDRPASPDAAPDRAAAPDTAPDRAAAPDAAPDRAAAPDAAPDRAAAPDAAPDRAAAPDTAPDRAAAPDAAPGRAAAPDVAPVPDPAPEAARAPGPPPAGRRTIQIGERPGPPVPAPPVSPVRDRGSGPFREAWAPRLVAVVALAVFVVIVVVLLAWAL